MSTRFIPDGESKNFDLTRTDGFYRITTTDTVTVTDNEKGSFRVHSDRPVTIAARELGQSWTVENASGQTALVMVHHKESGCGCGCGG